MNQLRSIRDSLKLITFDCYGTLIDWHKGLREALARLAGEDRAEEIVRSYVRQEAAIEQDGYRPYRRVLADTLTALSRMYGFSLPDEEAQALADSLPNWQPFPDTNEALVRLKRRYRLGILSNIDRDLLAGTCRHFRVDFDFVVTAEDVNAYKPAHPHFIRMQQHARMLGGEAIHAAQSIYHDGRPTGQLAIPFVWINRYAEPNRGEVPQLAEFPTLAAFADALEA